MPTRIMTGIWSVSARGVSAPGGHTFHAPGAWPPHHARGTEARFTGRSPVYRSPIDGHGADHLRPSKAANGRSRLSLRNTPRTRCGVDGAFCPAAASLARVTTTAARAPTVNVRLVSRIEFEAFNLRAEQTASSGAVENLPYFGQQL